MAPSLRPTCASALAAVHTLARAASSESAGPGLPPAAGMTSWPQAARAPLVSFRFPSAHQARVALSAEAIRGRSRSGVCRAPAAFGGQVTSRPCGFPLLPHARLAPLMQPANDRHDGRVRSRRSAFSDPHGPGADVVVAGNFVKRATHEARSQAARPCRRLGSTPAALMGFSALRSIAPVRRSSPAFSAANTPHAVSKPSASAVFSEGRAVQCENATNDDPPRDSHRGSWVFPRGQSVHRHLV